MERPQTQRRYPEKCSIFPPLNIKVVRNRKGLSRRSRSTKRIMSKLFSPWRSRSLRFGDQRLQRSHKTPRALLSGLSRSLKQSTSRTDGKIWKLPPEVVPSLANDMNKPLNLKAMASWISYWKMTEMSQRILQSVRWDCRRTGSSISSVC